MVKTRYLLIAILALAILVPAVIAAPTITVVSPSETTYSDGSFNVSAELDEASTLSFTYSDAPANYSMSLVNDTNYLYYNDSFTFTKGNFINFTFYAENENGTDEQTVSVTVNNSIPEGNITDNIPSIISNNDTITLNVTVTDVDGIADIDNVDFYYYNNVSGEYTLIGNDITPTANVFSFDWNTTFVPDNKTYTIRANISDGDITIEAESNEFAVANNNNAPTMTLIYPNENGLTLSSTVEINWTASDADNDTLTISFFISGDSGSEWTQITGLNTNNDGVESWDTNTADNNNNYRLKVIATDYFGVQTAEWSTYDFTISNGGTSGGDDDDDDSSSTTSSSTGGGIGDTTGYDFSIIVNVIAAGTLEVIGIAENDLAFTQLTVNVARDCGDVRIKIKDLDSSPTTVSPAGETYQYLQVDTTNIPDVDIATAIIEFKIPKSWFTENSLNKDTVELNRYVSNGWRDLTTTYVKAEGDYYYYSANTPGFSYFAIVAKTGAAVETAEGTGEAPKGTGLFAGVTGGSIAEMFGNSSSLIGIIVSIVVVMAFVGLIARKKLGSGRGKFKFPKIRMPDASGRIRRKRK